MVRTGTGAACDALGIGRLALSRLVAARVLDGDLDLGRFKSWVEYDPAWTRQDLWQRYTALGFKFEDESDVVPVHAMKKGLRLMMTEPWCDGFIVALRDARDGRMVTKVEGKGLFRGSTSIWKAAVERYAQLANGLIDTHAQHPAMELEDLMEGVPEALSGLRGTCLDEYRGILFERPEPAWIARVGAMPTGHLRWLATFVILVHPMHGGTGRRVPKLLGLIERMAAEIGGGVVSDAGTMPAVMRRVMARFRGNGDVDVGSAKPLGSYLELRDLVKAWLEWQKPDPETEDGAFLFALTPIELPSDLMDFVDSERERLTADSLKGRAITAGDVARRASQRLICVEARFRQWDRLCKQVDDAIVGIESDLDGGRPVRFPVRVSDTYMVVRPDGSIANGLRQTVDLEIVSEEFLWLEAAEASGWDLKVRTYLSVEQLKAWPSGAAEVACGRARERKLDGLTYSPGGDRRFHMRYVGTSPARAESDEHHPPYLVELYGASALVQSAHLTAPQIRHRNEVVDRLGLERASQAMMGLTWWTARNVLAHHVLRFTGRIILPYRQLRLTLAYGCAIARLELLTGMRIGESMQARHGGCFVEVPLGERMVPTMRGRPKGWSRDRLWVLDRRTMALLKMIKGWVIENWHSDINVLPIVEYGEKQKNKISVQCPPARYLFQLGDGRAAKQEHLNRCLRIATLGMPYAASHDYRYAFAKLLRIRRGTRRQRARAMSHELGSPSIDHYGNWDCEGLEDDDAIVAEHQEALAREMLDGLLDAA